MYYVAVLSWDTYYFYISKDPITKYVKFTKYVEDATRLDLETAKQIADNNDGEYIDEERLLSFMRERNAKTMFVLP